MSDGRLTDEELRVMAETGPEIARIDVPDGKEGILRVALVRTDHLKKLVDELRERRAADLSDDDRDTLEHARDNLSDSDPWQWPGKLEQKERALALLDRLLAQAGGR